MDDEIFGFVDCFLFFICCFQCHPGISSDRHIVNFGFLVGGFKLEDYRAEPVVAAADGHSGLAYPVSIIEDIIPEIVLFQNRFVQERGDSDLFQLLTVVCCRFISVSGAVFPAGLVC